MYVVRAHGENGKGTPIDRYCGDAVISRYNKAPKEATKAKNDKVQCRERGKEVLASQVPLSLAHPPFEQTSGKFDLLFIELNSIERIYSPENEGKGHTGTICAKLR